ncbi:MAG: hypothetical protein MHM6MM_003806 [Cercozoa sp. M6MM]
MLCVCIAFAHSKVPRTELDALLVDVRQEDDAHQEDVGILDCSIVRTRIPGVFQVSSTDFFYPLVQSPFAQGEIAAANVLSDMYALGLTHIDNVLMALAQSRLMEPDDAKTVTRAMIAGFASKCREAGTRVTGGQTVKNPWPIVGGVAMSASLEEHLIRPHGARAGDVLVLTKPLGTQLAVNCREWMVRSDRASRLAEPSEKDLASQKRLEKSLAVLDRDTMERAFLVARASMRRLNKVAARLMHEFEAHAATDVTGFGLLGHAQTLAQHSQNTQLHFEIDALPIIRGMATVDPLFPWFRLTQGLSSETSGGLLVVLPADKAASFCEALELQEGWPAWQVGHVRYVSQKQSHSTAAIVADASIIEV